MRAKKKKRIITNSCINEQNKMVAFNINIIVSWCECVCVKAK